MNTEAKMLIGIGLLTVAIIGGGVWLSSRSSAPVIVDASRLVRADSYQTNNNAKVTLVEFGDFQCPSCAAVYPILKQLKEEYKDRVNFVFRHFPLPMHKNAMVAAEAAEAAGVQGKFLEMHDMLFEHQPEWAESKNPQEIFVKYADALKLNRNAFEQAIDSKAHQEKIRQDMADGSGVKVSGTPTFFINNQQITGGISYTTLKTEIEKYLNQ